MSFLRSRITLLLLTCVAVAGVFAVRALSAGGSDRAAGSTHVAVARLAAPPDGSTAKFAFLSRQTSNRCSLEPGALMAMPNTARLQGSCCFPMNLAAYRSQVRGLRAYRAFAEIPRDPYDVPVSLAKRLLVFDRTIHLTAAQTRTYRRGMQMSHEKGPCCCRCWRWSAFRGMSEHLIADRRWHAPQVARVIDLVEGCGGPAD